MTAAQDAIDRMRKKVDDRKSSTNGATDSSAAIAHSMAALMRQQFAPIIWFLIGLIPQGTLLLAGKPKSGKSWFALNLLVAAKLQMYFLRREVTACDGLYLALEDTPKRMQSRMRTLMVDCMTRIDELEGFEYRNDWPKGANGAARLDEYLTARPTCRIVAVDVLAKIRSSGDRRGAYEQDYEAIACWKLIADKHGILLLIVHHTRKAEADDVFDEVSGTLAINGAVDQIMVLKRLASEPKQATLHMRGRDLIEDQELGLELRGGWWNYIATAAEIQANDARKAILDILREHQEAAMSTTALLKATGKRSRPTLTNLLGRMVEDRLIHRAEGGYRYGPKSEK